MKKSGENGRNLVILNENKRKLSGFGLYLLIFSGFERF